MEDYEQLLLCRPNSETVLLDLGTLSELEGKPDEAAGYYKRVWVNPSSKKAKARIAALSCRKTSRQGTIEFEKLSDLDRDDLSMRESIGSFLIAEGSLEEVIASSA